MKKLFYLFILTLMSVAVSCSNNDEPTNDDTAYIATVYTNAVKQLYAPNGEPAYTRTDSEGVYVASASSYDVSYNYICTLIDNKEWDGTDINIFLGENGTLKIVGETPSLLQQGIYNKIIVDIKNYEPYTLEIITKELAENGHWGDGVPKKLVE